MTLAILVAIIGLILFLLGSHPRNPFPPLARVGEILLFAGVLVWLMFVGGVRFP